MPRKSYSDGSSSFGGDTLSPAEVRALLIEELQKVHIELRSAKMALASACTEAAAHKRSLQPGEFQNLRGRVDELKRACQRLQSEISTATAAAKIPPPSPKTKQPQTRTVDTHYEAAQIKLAELRARGVNDGFKNHRRRRCKK